MTTADTFKAGAELEGFSPATRAWFTDSFAAPTRAQRLAWEAIGRGDHTLVIAPTGSGKTLAAFLSALDRLVADPRPDQGVRVLYVSPLKALAVDVERNLRAPLRGIQRAAQRLGLPAPEVSVGVRSGDTSAAERRRMAAHPPDILITTPESLFLMLTSSAREIFAGVESVIIDEIHVISGTKRGAHLSLTLERLQAMAERPIQRIGLSATVRPPERVASFLATDKPVRIVAPPAEKAWDLQLVVPVEDMAELGAADPSDDPTIQTRSIWPHVEQRMLDLIEAHRSTIVFANSRRLAERLTAHLNELHAERQGAEVPDAVPPPAQMMAQSGIAKGHDDAYGPVVARAHHGSVSKEQRAHIEADLKSGVLPCVVATSSLELGIDMGAVDLVIQVESPPSVASGLQRVGRAGHQVGATSRGVFFPNHRGDLVESAVVMQRMRAGAIEEIAELINPLDVLAQQIVAATAMDDVAADDLFALVRRSANFATLSRPLFDSVLDMLAGRYPSEDFAELRPRIVWDRESGLLHARPGAQRLAVTSGGTIPDRGLFGVFLVGDGDTRRVGELDEEMVYESRVGDVFTLGTSSWRIENITHDQVQVSPAPGQPGRLPFWKGDAPGRPAELGRAIGEFVNRVSADRGEHVSELSGVGLDELASENLRRYLDDQARACGTIPDDRTIVVERFRDELGDWRVCVHSALGTPVLRPWALAIESAARQRYGVEASATPTNDGIVLRIPDTESEPPGADLVTFDPDDLARIVTDEVGGSALFASRFRECAARALLLPRRDPRSRAPLWQQRMRSAQLLGVASRFADFPIVLEAVRECLNDVFDLESLLELQRAITARRVRVVEVETPEASPFAKSLLFGYVGEFVYEGDSPLAEKKAAALSLDASLLAELLGTDGIRQLLDPDVIVATETDLQWLSQQRRATTTEQVFDLLRTAGPFSVDEITARCAIDPGEALEELGRARRIAEVGIHTRRMWATVDDLGRLADGLGVPVPPGFGVPDPLGDPIEDLVLRWARTHGPFVAEAIAERYGLGMAVVRRTLRTLVDRGLVVSGQFVSSGAPEYCHHTVLALIKRRTLAALRRAIEPVDRATYARFLPEWQGVTRPGAGRGGGGGVDTVAAAIEQLAGYPVPASMLEAVILPCRVPGYAPAQLDELLASGEVTWSGDGSIGGNDGWIRLWPADLAAPPSNAEPQTPAGRVLLERLERGGGWFFDDLIAGTDPQVPRSEWEQGLWELVWLGLARSDTYAPVRAMSADGALRTPRRPQPRTRAGMLRASRARTPRLASPTTSGRWALTRPNGERRLTERQLTERLLVQLDRYGVLTKGAVLTEQTALTDQAGGFTTTYRALSQLEESGQCLRGYFIEGLGAAQFATAATVDRLRAQPETGALVLAATDPANAYGAALGWPESVALPGHPPTGHRPGRKPGALVVQVNGDLVLYIERGGHTLLSFTEEVAPAVGALAGAVEHGWLGTVTIKRADGIHVFEHQRMRTALEEAGFAMTPQGMRLRG